MATSPTKRERKGEIRKAIRIIEQRIKKEGSSGQKYVRRSARNTAMSNKRFMLRIDALCTYRDYEEPADLANDHSIAAAIAIALIQEVVTDDENADALYAQAIDAAVKSSPGPVHVPRCIVGVIKKIFDPKTPRQTTQSAIEATGMYHYRRLQIWRKV